MSYLIGHILLEGVPLEEDQFKTSCALVRHSTRLLPGLSVQQTLALSLTKVAHKCVTTLTKSEYRRLVIGVQLIRDPLCLSTVDRRSRERFIESNHQIAALVEKFRMEGQAIMQGNVNEHRLINPNKMQLGYGKPSGAKTIWMLYVRMLASIFNLKKNGFKQMFMRLFSLPLYFLILWAFYFEAKDYQRAFITKSGLIFNAMVGTYFISIMNTICLYPTKATRTGCIT
ncbi:hypothetical protein MSG28_007736 [Choristoneura fumiferana]|uniref:Uncharacterized protein n=1 Tax=Choristoneura fumiferana TaxID=7141 RepID=A0ACC0JYY6_CHOFU|nr:hypothetical protein MSG28_007736 [Choristoneura fumiferana]